MERGAGAGGGGGGERGRGGSSGGGASVPPVRGGGWVMRRLWMELGRERDGTGQPPDERRGARAGRRREGSVAVRPDRCPCPPLPRALRKKLSRDAPSLVPLSAWRVGAGRDRGPGGAACGAAGRLPRRGAAGASPGWRLK